MNPNEDKGFDRQMRDKFENFKPEVPTGLWDKIEAQLDAQDGHHMVSMARGRRRLPTWWLAVAATLLVVCGMAYWYSRPLEVTYLQGKAVIQEEDSRKPVATYIPEEKPATTVDPLDVERLKRLFAKKRSRIERNENTRGVEKTREVAKESPNETDPSQWVTTKDVLETEKPAEGKIGAVASDKPEDGTIVSENVVANVPDIKPPVILEDEEETMLASTDGKQPFGLSNILNYVVGTVDQREEKLVTFSNDNEGSLKLDFNFGLAKNKKKKIK
ncbi:hypothetical protein [Parapedobacter tibetensis]|uniref:hypothetical protein n=1 Tax=Parapedobacter tibetensis TaxID=2972951 RepID=UPI00214DCB97|nr:hypothetical protein [Parapedobacter tibetensis]